jgi:hypothetical protein
MATQRNANEGDRQQGLLLLWEDAKVLILVLLSVALITLVLFRGPFGLPHLTHDQVDFLAIVLATSGIVYAVVHEHRLRKQLHRLAGIEQSLSTRRIGTFPHYIKEITTILQGTSKVMILADCADHGSFFAPEDHRRLHMALCEFLATGGEVQLLVAGPPAAWSAAAPADRKRYWDGYILSTKRDRGFQKWLKAIITNDAEGIHRLSLFTSWLVPNNTDEHSGPTREKLVGFLQHAESIWSNEGYPHRDFPDDVAHALVQARQYLFEKRLGDAGASIKHQEDVSSVFMWIATKTDDPAEGGLALFAFPGPHPGNWKGAIGFRTVDTDLITTLKEIFTKRWERPEKEPPAGLAHDATLQRDGWDAVKARELSGQ